MLNFESDYTEGAHPKILENFVKTNFKQTSSYGYDNYSISAKQKIAQICNCPSAQIQFVCGGTQCNQIVIDSLLQSFEGVVCADTGHISCHEAGAIEYTGHKVLPLPNDNGKLVAADLQKYVQTFYGDQNHEHMVFPGMVYISHPTEYGTLYTFEELKALSAVCRNYKLPLYMDGARLGYGLASLNTDLDFEKIAGLVDVFSVGGTKVGAFCGEAIVFTKNNMPPHFDNFVKRHGALLAKSRLLGVQFDTLFTGDLYLQISRHAILMAEKLKNAFIEKKYPFFIDSPTNQQFVILPDNLMEELKKSVSFSFWEKYDDQHTVVRFATSWATTPEAVDQLIKLLPDCGN
ncbi:MAG: low specificity L-threonine aldolase [Treponemataceae bacterium]|nr:low specificity L-threonine aldolase [Treponemataceae bacterium]